jgi:hypothetical protein
LPLTDAVTLWDSADIHTTRDTTANLSLKRLLEFAKLGVGYVVELAS